MGERLLIELLESLSDPQNDNEQKNVLMERCLKTSGSELKEFLDELCESPDTYLSNLRTFISYFRDESPRAIRRRNLSNTILINFFSMLINNFIMQNLNHSDITGFGELLHDCIELLWRGLDNKHTLVSNKGNNQIKLTTKRLFTTILETKGALEVLVSETHGRRCLNRLLFEFNMINEIENIELLKAVDLVAVLLEKCSEHKDISKLSEEFSIYKSCNALLGTLRKYQGTLNGVRKHSLPPNLLEMVKLDGKELSNNRKRAFSNPDDSIPFFAQDEHHLTLLKMKAPRKPSDITNFLRDIEQRKIGLFKDLMKFLPCKNCYKRALVGFSPDKYSSLMEEEELADVDSEPKPNFRLPFEFNDTDKLGPWDILLSEDTIKDMQKLESPLTSKAVMKKLGQISSGEWDKHGLRCTEQSCDIPVYQVELSDDDGQKLKILWQVDYGFSIRSFSLTQLVKVWSITTNKDQFEKTLENLKLVHKVYSPEYNYRYVIQQTRKGIILPKNFEDEEGTKSTNDRLHYSEMDNERLLDVHKMLVTNKFIPLSKNLFKSLVLGGSGFTFNVSKIEYEIINNPTSAIIVGRSGTGKTTCIVFRLVASYLNNQICKTPSLHYKRQIFITVSHNLCRRVKDYFNRLRDSATLARKKMSIAEFNEYARKKEEGEEETDDNMVLEEEDKELDHIPNSFRQLTDAHFPLFVTYEKFSKMLLGTYGIDVQRCTMQKTEIDDSYEDEEEEFRSSFANISDASWFHFVDYDLFQNKYWPRFSDSYRKKLDCELVYSEFFVIKGTDPKVDYLSREEYRTISLRKFPVFRYNRDEVYDLFEQYEKMKAQNGDYDSVDRTLAILRTAKTKALGGPHIHEVYIDECQDNQIVDLALILKLFDRTDNIFMAGDIAQCIARGSSFRFQNLCTLMYEWEHERSNKRKTITQKPFELNVNYRSHNGILRVASSVIDLIQRFFPDSIDKLSRERSEVGGPRPIFFKGFRAETFLFDVFSVDENIPNCSEFGAEQVIIVRNEEAKKRVGKVGIVMTVFEAKGMEFNDVLLYNFFTDSPARLKWRVILSDLDSHSKGIQTFSHEKHYILSSELKHLYVAVTRARQHLWIFDEDAEASDPIQIYWKHDELIKVIQSLEEISTLPTLVKKSSSHEWNRKGKMFFDRRQFELAIFCYNKSGNEEMCKLANAYNLQKIARTSLLNNNPDDAKVKSDFISAAQAFEKCSRPIQAASCYQDIGMNKDAGDVYSRWDMYDSAAPCYLKANMWDKAGECFEKAEKYSDAVVTYKNGGSYKKVISLMQRHREKIDEKIFRRITRLVNIHYRRENDKEMSKEALSILSTPEERIELLRDHAPEELIEFCKENGKFRDAGKDLYLRGKFKEATDMFIRSDNGEDVVEALQCLLDLCRMNVLNIITDIMNTEILQELRDLYSNAVEIATVKLPKTFRSDRLKFLKEEMQLYSAYLNNDLNGIHKCIQFFRTNGKLDVEFRAINMWLQIDPQSKIQAEYWRKRLQYLLRLCELAFHYIRIETRSQKTNDFTKIYEDFENVFLIYKVENRPNKRKFFSEHPLVKCQKKIKCQNRIDNWNIYDIHDVRQMILQLLASYIFELILDSNNKGRGIPDIGSEICHKYGSCQKQDCHYHHVTPSPLILHQRLTLACLQYNVIQQSELLYKRRVLSDEQSRKVKPVQRWWGENLVKIHFRYQSPQTSCPEVTCMVIDRLSRHTYNGFIDLAHKIWLNALSNNLGNFTIMLKCIFAFHHLRYEWGFQELDWEMSKTISLSHPSNLPYGFEYKYQNYYEAFPVGRLLSLFFSCLKSDRVTRAITQLKRFIQYALNNADYVCIDTSREKEENAYSDLVSLMEFKISLIFAMGPGYCDFCLPRAYLVNYFELFTAKPLIPSNNGYKRENYGAEIKNSIEQIQQLLELLIRKEWYYLTIILRLIRLLVLIGRNESNSSFKIINLFKSLNKLVTSGKLKRYLEENSMPRLVNILKDDLKETGCDSLVIVHYQWGAISRFAELEKTGVVMLKYNSIEGFYSSLRKIKSSIVTEESDIPGDKLLLQQANNVSKQNTDLNDDEDEDDEQDVSNEDSELTTETQLWFRQIQNSSEAQEAAKQIQDWFRGAYERRQNSRQLVHDQILDKIYHDVKDFCCNISYWEDAVKQKGEVVVRQYKLLLKGLTVDTIVELTKLQDRMDKIKNKLQKAINNHLTDGEKLENCLNLEDDLKHIHYENIKLALKSLSVTEDSTNHKNADTEWLKAELQQAKDIIDGVLNWIDECKIWVKL